MEEASGQELDTFFHQWLYLAGQPMIEGAWTYDAAQKQLVVRIVQTQASAFEFPLDIGLQTADDLRIEKVHVDQKEQAFTFDLDAAPDGVVLDPETWLLASIVFEAE
jgi:aminopeptidase N